MSRKIALYVIIFLAAIISGIVWVTRFRPSRKAPCPNCNIIIISIDSLRSDALPCYGYKLPTAPFLCRFADENTLFTRMRANSTWTRPSNMSIMTSLYPIGHGMVDPVPNELNPEVTTLPEVLATHGYTTRFVANDQIHISMELGYGRMFQHIQLTTPTFDEKTLDDWEYAIDKIKEDNAMRKPAFVFFHTDHVHEYVNNIFHIPEAFPLDPTYRPVGIPPLTRFTDKTWKFSERYIEGFMNIYRVESVVQRHKAWLTQLQKAKTLSDARAVFMTFPPDMQEDIFRNLAEDTLNTQYFSIAVPLYRHLYDDQIRSLDLSLARVLDRIKQNGLSDNTIVVITSDHGQMLGERNLLGHIVSIAKEEIHVPLIMRVPGVAKQRLNTLIQHIDIFPTLLELVGIPKQQSTSGISLKGALLGDKDAPKNDFVISHATLPTLMYSIETDGWRLIEAPYPNGTYRELYDLAHDPKESKSVAQNNQKMVEQLTTLLHATLDSQKIYPPLTSTFIQWQSEEQRAARVENE